MEEEQPKYVKKEQKNNNNNNNNKNNNNNNKFNIKSSNEQGFDLETCFNNFQKPDELGYEKQEDYYYDSYSHFNIHEEMLKDKTRTLAYKNAIMKNRHLFEGKVVLDIGCGTGILSIFAAKAGAKQVIGVDAANIVDFTKKIIKENGLESKITILKGKVEEVVLPVKEVDIIISEWMGYFLLYESMLDCVLWARDKYLKKGGLLFPDRAVMYLSTIEDEEYWNEKINFWDSVYGVNMSCIKPWAKKEPLVECVEGRYVNGEASAILDIDLATVKVEDLDFSNQYKIKITRDDYVHAYVAWFECFFSHSHLPIRLTTSPFNTDTHWKQTVFYLNEPVPVYKGDTISGSIAVKKNIDNERNIDIKISTHLKNKATNMHDNLYFKLN